jgi:transposase
MRILHCNQLSVFQAASLIDPSISLADVVALIRKLERGTKALEMLLDERWRGWRSDFREPLLLNEIRISGDLLPGRAPPETLREELRPCVEAVSGLWMETKNLLQSISNAPEISSPSDIVETLMDGLEEFSGLFLNFEAVSAQR